MVRHHILGAFLIPYFGCEFLEKEDPLKKMRLGILQVQEMLKGAVVSVHNDLRAQEIWLKFLNCIHHRKQLLPGGSVVLLSLSKGLTSIVDDIRLLVPLMAQNRPNRVVTSITHNLERKAPIGQLDDRGGDEGLFNP